MILCLHRRWAAGRREPRVTLIRRRRRVGRGTRLAVCAIVALFVMADGVPVEAAKQRNGRIAFTAVRGGDTEASATRIVTMRPDGRAPQVLPCARRSLGECFDKQPDYSNDGRRLVTVFDNNSDFGYAAVRVRIGRVLSEHFCDCSDVAWSPGRRYLAFARGEVALLDLRTGRERRPLRMGAAEGVDWSRQGSLVADPSAFGAPFIVREPSGRRRRVRVRGDAPEWAPDGRRFAYACDAGACVVNKNDRRGRSKRVMPRGRLCGGDFGIPGGLAWSPDGRKLACFKRGGGVIVIDLHSRRVRNIAPNVFEAGSIDWAPRVRR